MRRQWIVVVLAVAALTLAGEARAEEKKTEAQTAYETLQKDETFRQLREHEIRAIVLRQLFREEAEKLRRKQEEFCKTQELDVEKWRKGLYAYDNKTGKFVEKQTAEKK